jgi:hypothetical protein
VVAFVASVIIGLVLLIVPFRWALRHRPVGQAITWGQAMLAAWWTFFTMFIWYGVIPHQWLTLADIELNWRADKIWYGPGRIIDKLPFTVNYVVLRDIIVVGIYGLALGLNVVLWSTWQNRGKKKPTVEVARSEYGRPLVRV